MADEPAAKKAKRVSNIRRHRVDAELFKRWMSLVLVKRGFDEEEANDAAEWATLTASYEVETHGPRKLLSLLDHEFSRSGSCTPQAQHDVLLSTTSLEVGVSNPLATSNM